MSVEAEIEIAAPPSKVREILLNFSNYSQWHTTFFKSLESETQNSSLSPGEKISCDADGMKFVVTITENSENFFQWQGPPVYGLVAGIHSFSFKQANSEGTATIFRQKEEFSGLIAFLMTPSLLGRGLLKHFKQFNCDLKACAEASN